MNLTRSQALNAFTPALPATDPARFVGRRPELTSSLDALQTDGMSILFHGPAGLGKTSLAAQVVKIAEGDTALLERLDATRFALPDDARCASVSVSAGDGVANTQDLLRAITRRLERAFPSDIPKDLVIGDFPASPSEDFRDELTGRVALALERLHSRTDTKMLIVVDELDRIRDTRGIATLVRELSGPQVTVLLLGISTGPEELLADHASVARQLQVVKVDPLPDNNITDILDVGILSLAGRIKFSPEARSLLTQFSSGHPWVAHSVAKLSLMRTFDDGREVILKNDVTRSARHFLQDEYPHVFLHQLEAAHGGDRSSQDALRLCAELIPSGGISEDRLYSEVVARSDERSWLAVRGLLSASAPPLIKTAGKMGDLITFADPMLAKFILLRND